MSAETSVGCSLADNKLLDKPNENNPSKPTQNPEIELFNKKLTNLLPDDQPKIYLKHVP